uniref:Uncharacterized protein n=1 Tax=Nelumbo nucifera TaxID=4432 RepID=A0A822XTQ7_NELNU|nr:TPA_asm: hypothetical protein HUJ06_023942 [Nelumbo nucifera]
MPVKRREEENQNTQNEKNYLKRTWPENCLHRNTGGA